MSDTPSERRLTENEVVFRKLNEQVQKGVEETNRLAEEDGQPQFRVTLAPEDEPLHFFCECADENCAERVIITSYDYREIHKHRNRFIVLPRHEVAAVEDIILEQPEYTVVQKHMQPPELASTLHPTSVDNA